MSATRVVGRVTQPSLTDNQVAFVRDDEVHVTTRVDKLAVLQPKHLHRNQDELSISHPALYLLCSVAATLLSKVMRSVSLEFGFETLQTLIFVISPQPTVLQHTSHITKKLF